MKRYVLLLAVLIAVTAGGIWILARQTIAPAPSSLALAKPRQKATEADGGQSAKVAQPAIDHVATPTPELKVTIPNEPPLIADPAKAQERIQTLTATLNNAYLEELARYLAHPSAVVRRSTLSSLVLFGDPEAVPFLQAAALVAEKEPSTATEAVALREAADLLSKPRPAGDIPIPPATPDQPVTQQARL